jgi:phage shock protein PspC (stress-responsive transcriptional regulator)
MNRKIAGVCAGLSARYGWDLSMVRLIAILGAVLLPPMVEIAYVVLWIALPEEPLYLPRPAGTYPVDNAG